MTTPHPFCMTATTFTKTGELDETALRKFLRRLIDARVGVYLGSTGMGEGHALTPEEHKRVYEIGVEEGKGQAPIHCNLPEQVVPEKTIRYAHMAAAAGIEVIHIYQPPTWHSYRPTDREFVEWFDIVA